MTAWTTKTPDEIIASILRFRAMALEITGTQEAPRGVRLLSTTLYYRPGATRRARKAWHEQWARIFKITLRQAKDICRPKAPVVTILQTRLEC